jgi:hypothetical protein
VWSVGKRKIKQIMASVGGWNQRLQGIRVVASSDKTIILWPSFGFTVFSRHNGRETIPRYYVGEMKI